MKRLRIRTESLFLALLLSACGAEVGISPDRSEREDANSPAVANSTAPSVDGASDETNSTTVVLDGSTADPATTLSPSFDVQSVIREVRLAFRESADAVVGHGDSFQVRATPDFVEFTPRVWTSLDVPEERGGESMTLQSGAPLRFRTTTFELGTTMSDAAQSEPEVDGEGRLSIRRGWATERFVNTAHATEQQWIFDERPSGAGDLSVSVEVRGLEFAGATAEGLHFRDPDTGIGVRYGLATWMDDLGMRFPVRTTYEDGRITHTILAQYVEAAVYPAVLDPVVSSETGLDFNPPGPPPGSQVEVELAFGGGSFLAVWQDNRAGGQDIYGIRVSPAGTTVETRSFPINADASDQTVPDVTFDGTNFLVVWQDARNGGGDIYGARVDPGTGAVLDTTPIAINTASGIQERPSISSIGGTSIVVWEDSRSGTRNVFLTRVNSGGTVLDATGSALSAGPRNQRDVAVDCTPSNCLVVWSEAISPFNEDLYGTRVNSAGAVLDAPPIVVSAADGNQLAADLDADATGQWMVSYGDFRTGSFDVYITRVRPDGSVVDAAGVLVSGAPNTQSHPAIAFDGTGFFIAWQDFRSGNFDIYGTEITTTGTVGAVNGRPIDTQVGGTARFPAAASTGSRVLVSWHENSGSADDVRALRVDPVGNILDPVNGFLASVSGGQQFAASVAWDGSFFYLVFADTRGTSDNQLIATRVDIIGRVIDPSGRGISGAPNGQQAPSITIGGSTLFLAWDDFRSGTDQRDVYAARISTANYQVLDPNGIAIATGSADQAFPSVAYDGTNFVVAYQERTGNGYDIFANRVNASGTLLDGAGVAVANTTGNQVRADVASNTATGQSLITWTDQRNGGGTDDVYAARYIGGSLADSVNGFAVSSAAFRQEAQQVAFDGTNYIVIWSDERNGLGTRDLYGARVTTGGTVSDPSGVALAAGGSNEARPAIVDRSGTLLMVWREIDPSSGTADLAARRFDGSLSPVAPRFVVSSESGSEDQPAVAVNTAAEALIAYHRFDSTSTFEANRVRARIVRFGGVNGTACSSAAQCDSGFCADGVCCENACGGGDPNDCQTCSVAGGSSANGSCEAASAGTTCRSAAGACDAPEQCDGVSISCPADAFQPSSTECRPQVSTCDQADFCTGFSPLCPVDVVAPGGTLCRGAGSICDAPEFCDGVNNACPADSFASAGTLCRGAAGRCDAAEFCTGASAACPADAFAPPTTLCRGSAGICDAAEFCTGTSNACPADGFAPAGTLCRGAAGICDAEEFCTGASNACPADAFTPSGTLCRGSVDITCDPEEFCTGTQNFCPANVDNC
jgi:hypothetical protein